MVLKAIGAKIDGNLTDIVLGDYTNKVLIFISQTEKLGSIIRSDREIFKALEGQENVFNIQTVFGKDDIDTHLIVRILSEKIETSKSVLFAISLVDKSPRTMKALIKILNENKVW